MTNKFLCAAVSAVAGIWIGLPSPAAAQLTCAAPDCAPGSNRLSLHIANHAGLCLKPGETVQVTLSMSCLSQPVAGFQAFLEFDNSVLQLILASYTPAPFGTPIITPIVNSGNNIDLAAGINVLGGQTPASADAVLAKFTFLARNATGSTTIGFRTHDPATQFSTSTGGSLTPTLVDSQTVFVSPNCPGGCTPATSVMQLRVDDLSELCLAPGELVVVRMRMECMAQAVAGYQAFIAFDPAVLSFVCGAYELPNPFGIPVITPIAATPAGEIDVAAGIIPGSQPTAVDPALLLTLVFVAQNTTGDTSVYFRPHDPPSRYSNLGGGPVSATLIDSQVIHVSPACVEPCSPYVGDVDFDADVEAADVAAAVNVWLGFDTEPSHVVAADANCDGFANGLDVQPFTDYYLGLNN
jgi:hypothetical protein